MTKDEMRAIRRELINDCLQTKWYTGTEYSLSTIKIIVRFGERYNYGHELRVYHA